MNVGLRLNNFRVSKDTLEQLKSDIERGVFEYFERNPDEEPLDSISVTFNFVVGFGRNLNVKVADKIFSFDLAC